MSYRATNSTATALLLRSVQNTSAITPRRGTKVLCHTKAPSLLSSRGPPRSLPSFSPVARRPAPTLSLSSTPRNTNPLRLPLQKPSHGSPFPPGRFVHDQANNKKVQAFLDAKENLLKSWKVADGPERLCNSIASLWTSVDDEMHGGLKENPYGFSLDGLEGIDDSLNERSLKPDAPWGSVVYRAAYGNDVAWEQMLRLLLEGLIEGLEASGRLDLLSRHRFVVVDDRSQFEGATPERVRGHFNKWVLEEFERNWREPTMPEADVARIRSGGRDLDFAGARYNFCLLIDDICLESLDRNLSGIPVAKLISKREPYLAEYEEERTCPWEGGMTDDEFENVGWMYKEVCEYVRIHDQLQEPDTFYDEAYYHRPPLLGWAIDFERAPGYWRRNRKT